MPHETSPATCIDRCRPDPNPGLDATAEIARLQALIENLTIALESRDTIGAAVGVLMATYKIKRDDAFVLLVGASQVTGRKVRDIAVEVLDTGDLTVP